MSYPGSSSEMLLAASALAYQRAAPSLRRSRRRAAAPAALLDDLGTHLTHFSLLADAGDAVVTPSGIEGFFEAAASKISALQQTVADSEASRSLATALDSGRALRLDNRPGLDKLDRSVLDAFEATVEGGVDGLAKNAIDAAENVETVVLDSIGHDILIFLACAAAASPLAALLDTTPILVYLVFGALLGPHGFDVFSSSEAGVELGDFGILFLLFSEGLEVTTERLGQLVTFLPLGLAQISMTAGVLSFAILGPLTDALERFIPLDAGLIDVSNPSEALVLALAGTLSTSAFVFPVLKERRWEERDSGKAATTILLLQDLFVAPLLVLLPFIVGQGVSSGGVLQLTAKATVGFGGVLVAGSYMIGRLYEVVAATRSSDTFVALSLLVAAGMGAVAKMLGLTDTAGAFAAGVLLANSNFKYEISASILPFKGILLGVFFLDAGSNFDSELLLREGPTVATGVALLLLLKAFTLWLAGFIDRYLPTATDLAPAENIRLAVLLAGGGEFAFVVLAAAEKLGALPDELNGLLTTIVLITMSLTPLLGGGAAALSELAEEGLALDPEANGSSSALPGGDTPHVASDAIVICGYGEVGASVSRALLATAEEVACGGPCDVTDALEDGPPSEVTPSVVCFDLNPSRLPRGITESGGAVVMYGDGANAELVRATGVTDPRAIIITYREPARCLSATQRLHANFPDAPIYARANGRAEREALVGCGASATILESEELAVQLGACLFLDESFQLRKGEGDDEGGGGDAEPLSEWETTVRTLRAVTKSSV